MSKTETRVAGLIVLVVAALINYFVGQWTWGIFNSPLMSLTIGSAIVSFILGVIGLAVFIIVAIIAFFGLAALATGE